MWLLSVTCLERHQLRAFGPSFHPFLHCAAQNMNVIAGATILDQEEKIDLWYKRIWKVLSSAGILGFCLLILIF